MYTHDSFWHVAESCILVTADSSLSWGYSTRERETGPPDKPESGFASRDSDQLLDYLRNIQKAQLKLLCSRVGPPRAKFVWEPGKIFVGIRKNFDQIFMRFSQNIQ